MSLRRGFDRALFSPRHRDRSWLETQFGVPTEHFVIMYAGKLNSGKNVPMLCPMMEQAAEPRFRWHAHPFVLRREGQSARRAGGAARRHRDLALPREELAGAYAAAGLFVFPSMIDESGNAAVEALGSGLPALLAAGSGVASRMARCTAVRVLPGDCRQSWAQAIAELAAEPARCRGLGMLARDFIEAEVPSWDQIVDEDLLPVWRLAVAARWPGRA